MEHLEGIDLNDVFCNFDDLPSTSSVANDIDEFINKQKKPATVKQTNHIMSKLEKWLKEQKSELRSIEQIAPSELNTFLSEYFYQLKKVNGQPYEPTTLNGIKSGIERYLKQKEYPECLITSRSFLKTREVIKAKMIAAKKEGLGAKALASERIEKEDEQLLISTGQLGDSNPVSLQFSLFYFFTKGFGLRGRQDQRNMKFGDITIGKSSDGEEYLELRERNSKMLDGSKPNDCRKSRQKIFAKTDSNLCPVRLFKLFTQKRPYETLDPDHAFFLTPIPEKRLKPDSIWYYATPMGHNAIGQLMKRACANAGISGKKTNHSLRKSTVAELMEAGVPASKIIKITGHKSVTSLQHYDGPLKYKEHKQISNILTTDHNEPSTSRQPLPFSAPPTTACTSENTIQSSTTSTSTTITRCDSTLTSVFPNATFQGCTFNFHIHHNE